MNRVESADAPIVVASSGSHFNPVGLGRSGNWLFGKPRMTSTTGCSKAGQQWSCDPFKPKSKWMVFGCEQ